MQDLTQGSIPKHVVRMAAPIMIGMLFQTLYFLIDLYFVARLGDAAIAGVGAAGNVQFIVMALTQILGVGTMALISHAVGRKDREDANLVFNQSLLLALTCTAVTLVGGYALGGAYMRTLGADAATTQAGIDYLYWFLPGLALQFAQIAMGSALRGTGIAKPTMVVQMLTVVLNAILAPVLIAGWLTGKPMGVAGAGLATSISVAAGVVMMALYFARLEKYVGFDPSQFHARLAVWKRILRIGLPPGGEFALMFVYMAVIYWVIRGFGAEAQAGFGIGQRVMQAIFLPAMAVAFATAPVAGQNVGARRPERVRATFQAAVAIGTVLMLGLTALCQWRPDWLVGAFTQETTVIAVAVQFLSIISLNFVASGLIFTCSGMFQALGNTLPAFLSSASRLLTFVVPAVWLSSQPGFELHQLWLVSVASVTLQAILSAVLLLRALRRATVTMTAAAPA
ncbi:MULTISPECIES: MATE family efflux transporter [unclassified Lysobacter]|uniref:MATE family efflux transporter n=1 Tax=unclassified Lysobacter TaxID=2635362 RepID=UPI0006FD5E0A|nr:MULTISPECIES: MATE family efflux transporter [unclassified Lysobacter]KRC36698.1 MATE family efflux transporter [Lysobacter sp. Root76]KRD66794.1 MATE family efflux transporter [Lysobacter sp. Root96]